MSLSAMIEFSDPLRGERAHLADVRLTEFAQPGRLRSAHVGRRAGRHEDHEFHLQPHRFGQLPDIDGVDRFGPAVARRRPGHGTQRAIFGVPLLVNSKVAAGTVWGLATDRTFMVLRTDVDLQISHRAYFTSDQIAVSATLRIGFAFTMPKAVAKIALSATWA